MSTTQDIFNQYLGVPGAADQKQSALTTTANQKMQGLSEASSYKLGAAAQTGLGTEAMATQEEADLLNLAPAQIIQKYGQERGTALLASRNAGVDQYNRDMNANRGVGQFAGDSVNQTLTGFGNALGGVAALGVGLVSDEGGAAVAGGMGKFDNAMRELRSNASRANERAMQARSELRQQETTQQYKEDIASGDSSTMAGLARIGRDFAGGMADAASDPTTFSDMAFQGVGSMAAIPAIVAGATAATPGTVATGAAALLASAASKGGAVAKVANAVRTGGAATAAIGAVESGSTYQSTVNQVMQMPLEELVRVSPQFNELVSGGMSPEDARIEIATNAGQQAAATQLPAALVAGALVSKFEAAPGATRTLRGALQNAGKEFVEEASQSGTSAAATNVAIADNVNPAADTLAGVGTQSGQSAIAGLGASGLVQAPGVAAGGAQAATDAVMGAVDQQVSKLQAKNEQASPVADARVQEQAATVAAEAPTVQEAVAADETLDDETKQSLNELVTNLTDEFINMDGNSYADSGELPPVAAEAARGQTTQIGFLQALGRAALNEELSDTDRVTAQVVLSQILEGTSNYLDTLDGELSQLPAEHPVRQFVGNIRKMNAAINSSPTVSKARKDAVPMVQRAVEKAPLTDATATDENAAIHLAASELAPEAMNKEGVDTLLKMSADGRLVLTQAQRDNLMSLAKLFQVADEFDTAAVAAGQTSQRRVSQEIKTGVSGTDGGLSALQHAQSIRTAIRNGDIEDATMRLEDLGMFAQHMQNKVNAINSHLATGNPNAKNAPSYMKLVGTLGNRQFVDSGKSRQGVTPTSVPSVQHAQLVAAEANFVTKTFNTMAETFPELGLKPMPLAALDSRLVGNAKDVAASFASGSAQATPTPAPTAKPTPEQKVAPKAEPAPVAEQQAAPAPVRSQEVTPEFEQTKLTAIRAMTDADLKRHLKTLTNDLMNEDSPRKARVVEMITAEQEARAALVQETAEPVQEEAVPVVEPVAEAVRPVARSTPYPDSVVQEVVYHTTNESTDDFYISAERPADSNKFWVGGDGINATERIGFYLTNNKSYSQSFGNNTISMYVNLKNPYLVKDNDPIAITQITRQQRDELVAKGYDGLLYEDPKFRLEEIVVFSPNQVAFAKPVAEVAAEPEVAPVEEQAPVVEPVVEEEVEESTNPMVRAFPGLVGGETNPFYTAFKLPMTSISNLETQEAPVTYVLEQTKDEMEPDAHRMLEALLKDFPTAYKHISASFNSLLSKPTRDKTTTRRQALLDGDVAAVTYFPEGRMAALATVDGDKVVLDRALMSKAYVAGINWLLNGMSFIQAYDVERAARVLGLPEDLVTMEHMNALSKGVTRLQAIDALATNIQRYLGVTSNGAVIDGYVKGIPRAMAANIIDAMTAQTVTTVDDNGETVTVPLLAQDKLYLSQDEQIKTPVIYTPVSFSGTPLAMHRAAIEKAVATSPELVVYTGDNLPPLARTQLHNSNVENTPEQLTMLENQNATSYYLNPHTLNVFNGMGEEAIVDLFGEGQLDAAVTNKNDLTSREGRNLSIRAAWQMAQEVLFQVSNDADDMGVDITEVPVHYGHNITSVGRAQQLGRYTPQSSKLMRTLFLPTVSKPLNLSSTDTLDYEAFMLGLGQALGVKVHNFTPDVTFKQVDDLLTNKFAPIIDMYRDQLKTGRAFSVSELQIQKSILGKASFETFQGLVEYARFLNTEDKSAYVTQLYLEADGMSNGPFNSMAMFTSGAFTETQLVNMAKSGLYIGGDEFTRNSWFKRTKDPVDLYGAVSRDTQTFVGYLTNAVRHQATVGKDKERRGATEFLAMQDDLNHMMDILLDDVTLVTHENGTTEIETKRGISKNPTTITTYGSGKKGIASKLANAMLDNLYRRISDALAAHAADGTLTPAQAMFPNDPQAEAKMQRLDQAVRNLTSRVAHTATNERGTVYSVRGVGSAEQITLSTDYTFGRDSFENLSRNVQTMFVEPMHSSIQSNLDYSVGENTTLLRIATQVQSIILANAYTNRVDAVQPKPGTPNYVQGGYLSKDQQREVMQSLNPLQPVIESANQRFFIANSEKVNTANKTPYGASFNNAVSTAPTIQAPSDAEVKGIATMVIGSGDGKTIQLVSQDKANTERAMFIFDGINYPLDYIRQGSRAANEAAFQAIMGNPMQAVADNYRAFLAELEAKFDNYVTLDDATKLALAKALHDQNVDPADAAKGTKESLLEDMRVVLHQLDTAAVSIQARHNVLASVNLGMDQMAAAGAPYIVSGKTQLDGEQEEIANQLNQLYREELAKLTEALGAQQATAEVARRERNQNIGPALEGVGVEHESGARILSADQLGQLVRSLRQSAPRTQVSALVEGMKNIKAEGYKVVYGTYENLVAYNDSLGANGIDMSKVDPIADSGMTLPGRKEIWLLNPTSETLAHEVIHASTFASVLAHMNAKYSGEPAVVSEKVAQSVDAIEALMNQFLAEADGQKDPSIKSAVAAITGALGNPKLSEADRMAQAVNEYMAWGLANQTVAKAQAGIPAKIATLVADTLKAIRKWLFNTSKEAEDVLSGLMFHTKVIMGETQPSLEAIAAETSLMQSNVYGSDQRISDINKMLDRKISGYLKGQSKLVKARRTRETTKAYFNADHFKAVFAANGFPMDMQAISTFEKVITVLGTQVELDPAVMARMQELYAAATSQLQVEHFMDDPEGNNPNDRAVAQKRYDAVMGKKGIGKDPSGRSTLLPAFLALTMVSEPMRKALAQMDVPRTGKSDQPRKLDRFLEDSANQLLDSMSDVLSGQKKANNITQAVDRLVDQLVKIELSRGDFYDQYVTPVGTYSDKTNQKIVEGMDRLSGRLSQFTQDRRANGRNQSMFDQTVNSLADLTAAVISEERAGQMGEAILAGANSVPNMSKWAHDLIADLVGRVGSNAELYDMIKKVRSNVQRLRNQFRSELPKTLAKQFSRKLDQKEWTALHSGIGRADTAALVQSKLFTERQALDMIADETVRLREIAKLEAGIKKSGRNGTAILAKSAQLAHFMMTGNAGQNLQRNALAIAQRLGTREFVPDLDEALINQVDALVSLYALGEMDASQRNALGALVRDEEKGVSFALGYALGLRQEELGRTKDNVQAAYNHYKGHMPTMNQDGVSLVVDDDKEFATLATRSYIRLANYESSSLDQTKATQSYFFAPVTGRAMFNQGILQNVRQTIGGVDAHTGYTVGGVFAGRITDPKQVRRIATQLNMSTTQETGTNLMPVFNAQGVVIAYERAVDPAMLVSLNQNTHMGEVFGAWKGRLAEESMATAFNASSIQMMGDMLNAALAESPSNRNQFINLYDLAVQTKYPVIADAMKLFTPDTMDMIAQAFPNGGFWVRRDMLDNVIGYRSATVGDAWTGNTYWSKNTQETVRKLAMTAFGNDAFRYLVQSEETLQGVVQDAKTLIIVKSVVVPVANFMSNMLQLVARGVPLRSIAAGMPKKLAETRQYVAGEKRAIEAEAELHATTDPIKQRKLAVEIRAIRDSFKRMSIWPLIERGELSSMSDDAQPEDSELATGKLTAFIEAQVDKLPPALRAAGKYALITKDTAIYKGLRKSVEYGDFLAKAILWDDLTKRQGRDADYAAGRVTEEFVNFDRLGGRNRQYLESVGLMWFYNFKIRSAKIGLSMIRNNPLHALLAGLTPVPAFLGSVGSPITDNIFSQIAEGSVGHSIGLGQLLSAPMLHPLENALF